MKKDQNSTSNVPDGNFEKKGYLPPAFVVFFIEMENGIAANSAVVTPVTVAGNIDQVSTDWSTNDDTTIDTPF